MKKILSFAFIAIFLNFISITRVNAFSNRACNYTINGIRTETTNGYNGIPHTTDYSYSKTIVCRVDDSKEKVSCSGVESDLDYNDFKNAGGCASNLYAKWTATQRATNYGGQSGDSTLVTVELVVSESKKASYSDKGLSSIPLTASTELNDNSFGVNDNSSGLDFGGNDNGCTTYLGDGTKGTPMYYINFAFDLIKYAAIVLLIVLTIIEFAKAVASGKDETIKKAGQITVKRLIMAVIIFFLPILINFILNILGISGGTCGIK